jgi:hypothetical protein
MGDEMCQEVFEGTFPPVFPQIGLSSEKYSLENKYLGRYFSSSDLKILL